MRQLNRRELVRGPPGKRLCVSLHPVRFRKPTAIVEFPPHSIDREGCDP